MSRRISIYPKQMGVALVTVLLWVGELFAQTEPQFVVRITDPPRDSVAVGREMIVKGTAVIPSGHHLWVLVRRIDYEPLWWPQREAPIDPQTHQWQATATLGEKQDIGCYFDIGVITVNADGHRKLKDYWMKAMETGDWKPIQIPDTSSPPKIVRVRKVRH